MLFLGFDIGSSSVKVSLLNGESGQELASAYHPKSEMRIAAPQANWAEQAPEDWWQALKAALAEVLASGQYDTSAIKAIGIAYQMHGLVLVDQAGKVLRPSIIWCDSRAVDIGQTAFETIGEEKCLSHLLNSPGNFTASKLHWVKTHEPHIYDQIHKIMLPGDYIAMRLSGRICTTPSGLSEGIFWDFKHRQVADFLLEYYGIDPSLLAETVPTFSEQGRLSTSAAKELGLPAGIPIAYRAGDQPNNALSLNVLQSGEIAATAGTSGVVYGVSHQTKYDPESRVNTFAHVNYSDTLNSLGILLCINGTGILYSWAKRHLGRLDYEEMNALAAASPIGAQGFSVLPFGNGAERVLRNQQVGGHFANINFNVHTNAHLFRGMLEGIVYSLRYGIEVMEEMGMKPKVIRAGHANLFFSEVFRTALATCANTQIELYQTDGAQGAARGAAIGIGALDTDSAFQGLEKIKEIEPDLASQAAYEAAYQKWKRLLEVRLKYGG